MFTSEKSFKYFFCEKCNYKCYTKFEFSKHILTSRHTNLVLYESWKNKAPILLNRVGEPITSNIYKQILKE